MNKRITRRTFVEIAGGGVLATAFAWDRMADSPAAELSFQEQPMAHNRPKVVRVYNPKAAAWDYKSADYLDHIQQAEVDEMVSRGVIGLTGAGNALSAWQRLFATYRNGDKIAIKPNFNSIHLGPRGLITCPQVIHAVIKGLVSSLQVSESDIYVYDLCKRIPQSLVKDRIGYSVNYVERRPDTLIGRHVGARLGWGLEAADKAAAVDMSVPVRDPGGNHVQCYIPRVITQCDHLINMALLSDHPYVAITGPLKNHFGTVRFSNLHSYPVVLHGEFLQPSIVDINLNPHIRSKTRLLICDALIGQFARGDGRFAQRWMTFPSDDGTPNSLFFGMDPAALESVLLHFVNRERAERGLQIRRHDYLHVADEKGLGVHEDIEEIGELQKIAYEVA